MTAKPKLLLIHPPKRHQVWAGVPDVFSDRFAYLFPPLAVMQLSAYIKSRSDYNVDVLDCIPDNLSFSAIGRYVERCAPEIIGIAATATHNLINVSRTVETIRRVRPQVLVIMGGPHVNSFPEQATLFPGIDAVIAGDGEEPLLRLLDAVRDGRDIRTTPNLLQRNEDGSVYQSERLPNVKDLDSLPFPDRDACPPGKYFTPGMKGARATTMISSRGCPFHCVFCNVPHFYRSRSPENIVDEIERCVTDYHVQEIQFVDDLFNATPERVIRISEEILRRRISIWWGYKASVRQTTPEMIELARRAGCYRMHYGVETYTDEGLRALDKKVSIEEIQRVFRQTQERDVKAIAYMIIGSPHEKTAAQVVGVSRFIKRLSPNYVVYSLFTPYPDAPISPRVPDAACGRRIVGKNSCLPRHLTTFYQQPGKNT